MEEITKKTWGFLRETTENAEKAGIDKATDLPRTGLNEYLSVIFPETTDWVHDKSIGELNGKKSRCRPDYKSESLKLIVEFDGLQHYTSPDKIIDDYEKKKSYENAGYKCVRIPYFIQLTQSAVKTLFGVDVSQPLFDPRFPSLNIEKPYPCSPAYLCPAGIARMAKEFRLFPEQYKTNVEYLESLNEPFFTGVDLLKFYYAKEVVMNIENRIIQIFHQRNDDEPESDATAFLYEFEEGIALVTAAHVADDETICVATKESFSETSPKYEILTGIRVKSKMPNSGFRDDDKRDWAIICLTDEIKNALKELGKEPFKGHVTKYFMPLYVSGFPVSACKNKTYDNKRVIKSKPYQYYNVEASDEIYSRYGYNKDEKILIPFHGGKGIYDDKPFEFAKFRHPKGMSGCPITDRNGMLVAFFTEWTPDKEFLVGTRIDVIVNDFNNGKYDQVVVQ